MAVEKGDTTELECNDCGEVTTHTYVPGDMGGLVLECENWEDHPPLFGGDQ
jgi:hypothetical protein